MDKQSMERELRIENARLVKLVDTLNGEIASLLYDNRRLKELEEENAILRKAKILSSLDYGHTLDEAKRNLEKMLTPDGRKEVENIYREYIRMEVSEDTLGRDLEDIFDGDIHDMMECYGLKRAFELEEIGFPEDTTLETDDSLIEVANFHCESYEERKGYLPIDTVEKAIKYFTENGFVVREIPKEDAIATIVVRRDKELYETILNTDENSELYDIDDLNW